MHSNTPVKPPISTGNFPDKSFAGEPVLMCALCRAGRIFTHNELKIRHSQKFNKHSYVLIYEIHFKPKIQTKQKEQLQTSKL